MTVIALFFKKDVSEWYQYIIAYYFFTSDHDAFSHVRFCPIAYEVIQMSHGKVFFTLWLSGIYLSSSTPK